MKQKIFFLFFLFCLQLSYAGGFIVDKRYNQKLIQQSHKVKVNINNGLAVTSIEQVFYNPTSLRIEGYYIIPIPSHSTISKFSMFLNGKELKAELLNSTKAKNLYKSIVRSLRDPALLQFNNDSLFQAKIYPIEPYSKKIIKISYVEFLKKDDSDFVYVYPKSLEAQQGKITVMLSMDDGIKNIYSLSHKISVDRVNAQKANVTGRLSRENFMLYFNTEKSDLGISSLNYQDGDDGFFYLNLTPSIKLEKKNISPKNITFVLDVSGSMAGKKLKQAKQSLKFCIDNLNPKDEFQVIAFSTEAEALFTHSMTRNESSLKKAHKFIDEAEAIGGTNIEEALSLAFSTDSKSDLPHFIVLITDGKPTIGETKENNLLAAIGKWNNLDSRIFTLGIGNEVNTHLLDKIVEQTHASGSYIGTEEDIEMKISNFYQKIKSPILTDVQIKFSGDVRVYKVAPKSFQDIFAGGSLGILGRYKGEGKVKIEIQGIIEGREKIFYYNTVFTEKHQNSEIARLWAARRIGYLLTQIRLYGTQTELVNEIKVLAKKYGIITPYTSYLILEDEKISSVPIIRPHTKLRTHLYEDAEGVNEKSGKKSVNRSKEFAGLRQTKSLDSFTKPVEELEYRDDAGKKQNFAKQVRYVKDKTFFKIQDKWIDRLCLQKRKDKIVKIQFASEEYFNLIKFEPLLSDYLSIGKEMKFYYKGRVYDIYE